MKITENKCRKCRYYLSHYIKSGALLVHIDGHCITDELRKLHPRKAYRLWDNCEFWEPMEIQIAERRRDIERVLEGMEQRLNDITLILKDDAQYSNEK